MMGASVPVASGRPELQEGMAIALDLLRVFADPKGAEAALRAAMQQIADREQAFAREVEKCTAELDLRERELEEKFAVREAAIEKREAAIRAAVAIFRA